MSQTDRLSRIRERLNAPLVRGRERGGGVLDSAQAGTGYGIFAGDDIRRARMRFSARSARWVSAERWHPNPHGHWDSEGRWCLRVPYADPRELRQEVIRRLQAGLSNMGVDE